MSDFSEKLAAYLREHPEWNATKLALAAGLDKTAVRKITELGYSPRLATVKKIADALGEPVEYFTGGPSPEGLTEIQRLFALLTPEEQAMIKTTVSALVAQRRGAAP